MQVVNLDNFDLLAVSGPDAKKFLQGQVTCDVDQLSPSRSLRGAVCNLKGRVICDFRLLEHEDTCYLQLASGMGSVLLSVLGKYIVFSKAEIELANSKLTRWGLLGGAAAEASQSLFDSVPANPGDVVSKGSLLLVRIAGTAVRFELWSFAGQDKIASALPPSFPAAEAAVANWELENIKAGVVHVTPALSEQQLPEALNYDVSDVINFKKGCYTGQEVVARMYYRGTPKKRLYHVVAQNLSEAPHSIEVQAAEGEALINGELLSAEQDAKSQWHVAAILPVTASNPQAKVIVNSEAEADVPSLPYVVDRNGA